MSGFMVRFGLKNTLSGDFWHYTLDWKKVKAGEPKVIYPPKTGQVKDTYPVFIILNTIGSWRKQNLPA